MLQNYFQILSADLKIPLKFISQISFLSVKYFLLPIHFRSILIFKCVPNWENNCYIYILQPVDSTKDEYYLRAWKQMIHSHRPHGQGQPHHLKIVMSWFWLTQFYVANWTLNAWNAFRSPFGLFHTIIINDDNLSSSIHIWTQLYQMGSTCYRNTLTVISSTSSTWLFTSFGTSFPSRSPFEAIETWFIYTKKI